MARWDSTPGGDKPRTHDASRGNGGAEAYENEPRQLDTNPQSETPGWDNHRRARWAWLKGSLADVAGSGHAPDRADVEALPESHRAKAREIVAKARELHAEGSQQDALAHAREGFLELEDAIGNAWSPPRPEGPDDAVLDAIQGMVH